MQIYSFQSAAIKTISLEGLLLHSNLLPLIGLIYKSFLWEYHIWILWYILETVYDFRTSINLCELEVEETLLLDGMLIKNDRRALCEFLIKTFNQRIHILKANCA